MDLRPCSFFSFLCEQKNDPMVGRNSVAYYQGIENHYGTDAPNALQKGTGQTRDGKLCEGKGLKEGPKSI